MRAIYLVMVALALSATAFAADEPVTPAQKRVDLRDRIAANSRSADAHQAAAARVARLTDNQVDALLDYYRSGKAERDQRAAQDLDRQHDQQYALRAAAVAAYQQRLAAARGGRVGYAPVITTLPSGASLGASAVVSPDRRYVRVSAAPFFSQVNGYSTFNMANGQTRYYPLNPAAMLPFSQQPNYNPQPALQNYVPRPALQPR